MTWNDWKSIKRMIQRLLHVALTSACLNNLPPDVYLKNIKIPLSYCSRNLHNEFLLALEKVFFTNHVYIF